MRRVLRKRKREISSRTSLYIERFEPEVSVKPIHTKRNLFFGKNKKMMNCTNTKKKWNGHVCVRLSCVEYGLERYLRPSLETWPSLSNWLHGVLSDNSVKSLKVFLTLWLFCEKLKNFPRTLFRFLWNARNISLFLLILSLQVFFCYRQLNWIFIMSSYFVFVWVKSENFTNFLFFMVPYSAPVVCTRNSLTLPLNWNCSKNQEENTDNKCIPIGMCKNALSKRPG